MSPGRSHSALRISGCSYAPLREPDPTRGIERFVNSGRRGDVLFVHVHHVSLSELLQPFHIEFRADLRP
jgi:hypothetical protein